MISKNPISIVWSTHSLSTQQMVFIIVFLHITRILCGDAK